MIVDDEASIRDMLAFFFHKRGFEAMTASSFTEGVAAAARFNPDLILSDIKMPDGNGLDLLRKVTTKLADDADFLYYLGMSHYRLKQYPETRIALQHALNANLSRKLADEARHTLADCCQESK